MWTYIVIVLFLFWVKIIRSAFWSLGEFWQNNPMQAGAGRVRPDWEVTLMTREMTAMINRRLGIEDALLNVGIESIANKVCERRV